MQRRNFLQTLMAGAALLGGRSAAASAQAPGGQGGGAARGPIIDIHMHGYPADMPFSSSMTNPATGKPTGAKDGAAHLQMCLAEMKRLNIVKGVVSGGDGDRLAVAAHWHDADPDRFIPGAGIRGSAEVPLPEIGVIRKAFQDKTLRVLGEITAQYAGLTLGAAIYEPYLNLCEEFDVPAAVHMGVGPPGGSFDPCCRGFRVALGNPGVLEEALNQHPKLRLNIMHGGWPYLQDTIAILFLYPQCYTDLAAINWLLPRAEFHNYLAALVRAGFGKRILFGSDQMYWAEGIGLAVESIEAATFLSAEEKRDIFYNNAVSFLKLAT